jgi:hypothetical protein
MGMGDKVGRAHDFEARLYFHAEQEGGRVSPPHQGYRPDMRYPDFPDDDCAWMAWPLEFFTEEGDVPPGVSVPRHVSARFWILNPESREAIHRPLKA